MIKYYQHLLVFFACFFLADTAIAQKIIQPKQIDYGLRGILYKEETAVDLTIHTNGFAIGMNFGKIQTYYKTKYFHVNLGVLKHPKEYRQPVNFQSGTSAIRSNSSFTYGKKNNLIVARAGYGVKRYFSEKAKRKGVAVGISYEGGASLGVLKPYFLELSRLEGDGTEKIVVEKYSDENADEFLNISSIQGSGPFFKGFGNISIAPGFHGKIAMHFSLGAFDQFVRAVEVGIMMDGYFRKMPIMLIDRNQSIFLNAYLTVQLGKRK